MNTIEKNQALLVLNSLPVIEEEINFDGSYMLVENNEENRLALNAVGIPDEFINKFVADGTIDIMELAFTGGLADLYTGNRMIRFDKMMEFETDDDEKKGMIYQSEGKTFFAIMDSREPAFNKAEISPDKLKHLKIFNGWNPDEDLI